MWSARSSSPGRSPSQLTEPSQWGRFTFTIDRAVDLAAVVTDFAFNPISFLWPAGEYTLVLDPVGPATDSLTLNLTRDPA